MLLFVQFVQIARATTTYEAMRGHTDHGSRASEAITAALTSGSTSMSGAALSSDSHHGHRHEGCFAQWKKLLGLDTFVATAQGGIEGGRARRRGNPYSRGIITNCKDFWFDPAPIFKARQPGDAMLDGEIVNYTRMYETPPRMKVRRGDQYQSLDGDDAV